MRRSRYNERVRRLFLALIALLLWPLCLMLPIGVASAHSELVSSSPSTGETLNTVPTEVVLTFSEEVNKDLNEIQVTDGEGIEMTDGDPVIVGATVTQALLPDVHPGSYSITYKVVSADGHPISAVIPFAVASSATTGATSSSSSSEATSRSTTTSATTQSSSTPSAATSAETAGGDDGGSWLVPALFVSLGLLAGLALVWTRRGANADARHRR